MQEVAIRTCVTCGASLEHRRAQARYCTRVCKRPVNSRREKQKRELVKSTTWTLAECSNPLCDRQLLRSPNLADGRTRACSLECSRIANAANAASKRGFDFIGAAHSWAINHGLLAATRVYFKECRCGVLVCTRSRNQRTNCPECARRAQQAIDARKNHARRVAGRKVLSVHQIAERDGTRCHICRKPVDMSLSGRAKWGPTIEHILPVSKGGTNNPENLSLAHWQCNTVRGNRGFSQLLLSA